MTRYSAADLQRVKREAPAPSQQSAAQLGFRSEDQGITIAESARKDLEATLQLLADRAQYITGGTGAAIALRDGDHVLCRASSGMSAPRVGSYLELGSGLSGESVRSRTTLRCDDADNDPRVDKETCRQIGIACFAVMPIIRRNEVVGIFEIFAGKPNAFEERDMVALQRLGDLVNTALDQAAGPPSQERGFALHGASLEQRTPESGKKRYLSITESTSIGGSQAAHSASAEKIQTCQKCGFPVSHGRSVCLDCEAKGETDKISSPMLLADQAPEPGMKLWLLRNRYVIGMIVVSAATITYIILR